MASPDCIGRAETLPLKQTNDSRKTNAFFGHATSRLEGGTAKTPRELQLVPDSRVPLTRGEVVPFFPLAIPDPLTVRADVLV
jgi:hypothetical protein